MAMQCFSISTIWITAFTLDPTREWTMKPELKDKLFRDFPGVFADGGKIGCGDGWYP